jgi:TonB family protein
MPIQFIGSPLAHSLLHALGWTLLHFCWQGAIVAGVLWCALELMAGRSSQASYLATCLAFLLLVALPLITFARIAAAGLKSGQVTWNSSIAIDPAMLLQVNVGETAVPWPARLAVAVDHRMPWLLAVWLAGAIFFVARLNYGLLVASRLKSAGTESVAAEFSQMFEVISRRLGISRAVHLLHSARVQVPTVIGWLRPVVLIPASCLTGLSTEQIEAIFCHELAHVRRHDYLVSVFQSIAEALLFYHPAVWWISKQVRRERECCCDEIAVANGGDVLAYAKALSYLEERRAAFPEFVLGANGGVLSMRIKRLLGYKEDAPASQFAALALLVLMIAVAGSYVVSIAHAAQPKPQPGAGVVARFSVPAAPSILLAPLHAIGLAQQQSEAITAQDTTRRGEVYLVWLNQDAAYIITPEERAAFLNLANDEERDKFIEQFWARRDPPGSAPNTFKAEIYARFAYSNEHFASNTKPGWTTDRGRIYIVSGKPFEIDDHPGGDPATNNPPYEVWYYRGPAPDFHETGLRFVDTAGDGSYRLAKTTPAAAYVDQPLSQIGGSVAAPLLIYMVSPEYTPEAKAAKFNGIVLVHLIVDQDGRPQKVQVLRDVGMGLGEQAALAVKQYKFKPAMEDGKPVPVEINVEVKFSLDSSTTQKTTSTYPADRNLFDDGTAAIKSGRYEYGRAVLQTLVNRYPDSPFVPRAQLTISESLSKREQP